jgi:hypothetical protein
MLPCVLYRIEEHHEAFLAWHMALAGQSSIARTLVHIDEHADFGTPDLKRPLPHAQASAQEVARFVYRQLSIGTFLIPAALAGFFTELVWIRPSQPPRMRSRLYRLTRLPAIPYWAWRKAGDPHDVTFRYTAGRWSALEALRGPWMLDICLDAFACRARPSATLKLEITSGQYAEIARTALNPWNARYGSAAEIWTEQGRYFFGITGADPPFEELVNQNHLSKQTMRRLRSFEVVLKTIRVAPEVITLVRSVRSGYTPAIIADVLEEHLLTLLKEIFPGLIVRNIAGFS